MSNERRNTRGDRPPREPVRRHPRPEKSDQPHIKTVVPESASDRAQFVESLFDGWTTSASQFVQRWAGFNRMYNAHSGSERDRLMRAVESGLTELQAGRILLELREEISFFSSLPPGDMRRRSTDPQFRARAVNDMAVAVNLSATSLSRLAHLASAVYQVRCNLLHGDKIPALPRNHALIAGGESIIRHILRGLQARANGRDTGLTLIEHTVRKFREGLDALCPTTELGPAFEHFPSGSCGEVSSLLAAYLEDRDCGPFEYVWGWTEDRSRSHGWLRQQRLVVDITADQFGLEKVIVADNSPWHETFHIERSLVGGFRQEDEATRLRLENTYRQIVSVL